jgi:RNA polymerase sigma-70 factor (ECF subfamily)
MDMMAAATATWEGLVGLDSEVARLRRGAPDAFEALLARYQNRLYRYLQRLVREPAVAEDLFQQTWLRVVQNIRSLDPGRNFEPWLFRIAHNLAIDHLRRHRMESLDEPLPSGEPAGTLLSAPAPGALELLLRKERGRWLAASLGELPAIQREVLTLRFEEEMKLEEIAEVLDIPLSTAKSRLKRALDALRLKLESGSGAGVGP